MSPSRADHNIWGLDNLVDTSVPLCLYQSHKEHNVKIIVKLEVIIDPAVYRAEYDDPHATLREIRDDVECTVQSASADALRLITRRVRVKLS